MSSERSFSELLQAILRNVQEIMRSEVCLVKAEFREEAAKAKTSIALLGFGALAAMLAVVFLLLTIVFALGLVMPLWASALIVGGMLATAAVVMFIWGIKRFKQIHPTPERTLETMKENVQWAKQYTK